MFPLQTDSLPPDAQALREALENSLEQVMRPAAGPMVSVEDKSYPALAAIRFSLDGASAINQSPPKLALPNDTIEPALQVENFEITGRSVRVQEADVDLHCWARNVQIGQARSPEGKLFLLLCNAAEGEVEVAVTVEDLESLVLAGAKAAAARPGVTVERVQIDLSARSERALDVVVHVRAKKLFLTASVRISGSATIDEHLSAKLSGLECDGEGTLGTLACGFIAPQLQRFDKREFSLLALPLGELKLRDVRIGGG
ncbi:MAG: hypothetical protein ACR2G0_03275, partial [Chthoniobacterales bacterium]